MVTVVVALVVIAGTYAGWTYLQRSEPAFLVAVAVTLALWGAPFIFPPSYTNALYIVLGLVGSFVCGLTGMFAWWRLRRSDSASHWLWLVGGVMAVSPPVLLGFYQLLR